MAMGQVLKYCDFDMTVGSYLQLKDKPEEVPWI